MLDTGRRPIEAVEELVRITSVLSTERDLDRLLHLILSAARRLTGAEAGRIYTLDQTKRTLLPTVIQNDVVAVPPALASPIPLFQGADPNLKSVCSYSATTGLLVNLHDVYAYTGFDCANIYAEDARTGFRTRAMLVTPLRNHEDITIGMLELANARAPEAARPCPFPEDSERLVRAFAAQAAVALSNAMLIQENRELIRALNRANDELKQENFRLRHQIAERPVQRYSSIIGDSAEIRSVFALMDKVLASRVPVLLLGETGTGKEVFARAIHRNSNRAEGPFIVQNCAALPENLLESELFGHRRGAFTGAVSDRQGLIEAADGGTLFLDEIGDMPVGLQSKLLRVLQDNEVRPIGGTKSRVVDLRVIAATHHDLREGISRGEFREDLYYRLCVFPITLPPLRQRTSDIPLLIDYFIAQAAEAHGKRVAGLTRAAFDLLMAHAFPGNVRELKNVIERAVLLCDGGGRIGLEHLPVELREAGPEPAAAAAPAALPTEGDLRALMRRYEAAVIAASLAENAGNQTRVAARLRISRRSLVDKIGRYNIRSPRAAE